MSDQLKTLIWLRRDLRLEDNKLLKRQINKSLLFFSFDEFTNDFQKEYLKYHIFLLKEKFRKYNLDIALFEGKASDILNYLSHIGYKKLIVSVDYNKKFIDLLENFKSKFDIELVNNSYIFSLEDIKTKEGNIYRVFSPYYKAFLDLYKLKFPIEEVKGFCNLIEKDDFDYDFIYKIKDSFIEKLPFNISNLNLKNDFYKKSAKEVFEDFLNYKANSYKENRDILSIEGTSKLSFYINFGLISIREVFEKAFENNLESFMRELVFREFFAYFYGHFSSYQETALREFKFLKRDSSMLDKFFEGKTGIPIVDAGIRELLNTNFMHNRARMIVGSFLTKDLMSWWKIGEKFFRDHLIDYDHINNIASWQWVSGEGLDTRPLRIFNPYLQSLKFDQNCKYIKRFVKELENVDCSIIQNEKAIEKYYMKPIVYHKTQIDIYKSLYKSEFPK